jgi:Ca-activated chloride channel family protein
VRRLFAFFLAVAVISAGLLAPSHVMAQEPPALTLNQVDATGYPEITAIVTAVDGRGLPIAGLTADQFAATDGAQQVSISSVEAAQDTSLPLGVIITIDVSGSMEGAPLEAAKAAATDFIRQLGPSDQAALVTFNNQVQTVVPLTSDKVVLSDAVKGLQAGGATALFEAVQASSFAANGAQTPRSAVVLLSDGENQTDSSTATADGSVAVATGAQAPIFTIAFGSAPDTGYLQRLAGATQGQFRTADATNVQTVYADLAALLRSQYVVKLHDDAAADGGDGTLRIEARVGGATASAEAPFKRGTAPVVPTAAPTVASAAANSDDGGGSATGWVLGAGVGLVAMAALAFGAIMLMRSRRERAHQLATVAPNPRSAARQGVPEQRSGEMVTFEDGVGQVTVAETGETVEFGSTPVTVGTGERCEVRVPPSDGVAREHARLWMKSGRMNLRHVAEGRRTTLVAGRPVDWVILDDGDEVVVGGTRLRVSVRRQTQSG